MKWTSNSNDKTDAHSLGVIRVGSDQDFRQLGERGHRCDVAVRSQSANNARRDRRNLGMPVILVAGVDVGDVHFDDRPVERLDRIEDRNRGEGIAGRIDDDGVRVLRTGSGRPVRPRDSTGGR